MGTVSAKPRVLSPASVQKSSSGALGFDTDTVLTAASARSFYSAGFRFAIRYLSLDAGEESGDLTTEEAQLILTSGLALIAAQHAPYSKEGWAPTQALGRQYGQNAAANAQSIGLPPGMNVWLDLEGIASSTAAAVVASYCNAWFEGLGSAGYVPGVYVGANSILSGSQLYDDLTVTYYWRSGSDVPIVAVRGYCMVQTISASSVIDGVTYDQDVIQADNMGNTPLWVVA